MKLFDKNLNIDIDLTDYSKYDINYYFYKSSNSIKKMFKDGNHSGYCGFNILNTFPLCKNLFNGIMNKDYITSNYFLNE